jgi:hypothetical protein
MGRRHNPKRFEFLPPIIFAIGMNLSPGAGDKQASDGIGSSA